MSVSATQNIALHHFIVLITLHTKPSRAHTEIMYTLPVCFRSCNIRIETKLLVRQLNWWRFVASHTTTTTTIVLLCVVWRNFSSYFCAMLVVRFAQSLYKPRTLTLVLGAHFARRSSFAVKLMKRYSVPLFRSTLVYRFNCNFMPSCNNICNAFMFR